MIETKPWSGGVEEEYQTQHFGFGAQRLKISIRQMIEQKIKTGVKDMESFLEDSMNLNDTDKVTLTQSCDKLVRLYCERATPSMEVIDSEIDRILEIPANVLLPENDVQVVQTSDNDYEKLKLEISDLQTRIERSALMEALLMAEEEELSSFDKVCEDVKKNMDFLDLVSKQVHMTDLNQVQTETQFLCASAPILAESESRSLDL